MMPQALLSRSRLRRVAWLLAALFAALPGSRSSAGEVRALWVVRTGLTSPAEVDRVVEQAKDAGFNTLIVQVRGRGDAFYSSQILPRSVLLQGEARDFDPLARLLAGARVRGLAVHAWINVLLSGNFGQPLPPRHELVLHPEWMMIPRSVAAPALHASGEARRRLVREAAQGSDAEGYYISPWAPGVSEHLEAVVRELARNYAVDGVHLDFIRYPGPEYDYSHPALLAFRPRRAGRDLLAAPQAEPRAWDEQRCAGVTALVARLAAAARAARPAGDSGGRARSRDGRQPAIPGLAELAGARRPGRRVSDDLHDGRQDLQEASGGRTQRSRAEQEGLGRRGRLSTGC